MKTYQTLETRLQDETKVKMHEGFVDFLYDIASKNDREGDDVYQMWREYSEKCTCMDQSPIRYEFLNWYKLKE